jgi:HAD superfamily hydrolase (TIGR01490 family)
MNISTPNYTENPGNYIAFFDLDRTITENISGKEFVRYALKEKHLSFTDLMQVLLISLANKLKIVNPLRIINKMVRWIEGMPVETMEKLSYEVFHNALVPSIYSEVPDEIKLHKERNARVVILSSSIAPVCSKIAGHLGFDDVICSELEIENGKYTGRSTGPLCYGHEKVNRLVEYCNRNSIAPENAWYYADSISDLPVLKLVGTPVCVNPDKKLLKYAGKRGWKINFWH